MCLYSFSKKKNTLCRVRFSRIPLYKPRSHQQHESQLYRLLMIFEGFPIAPLVPRFILRKPMLLVFKGFPIARRVPRFFPRNDYKDAIDGARLLRGLRYQDFILDRRKLFR